MHFCSVTVLFLLPSTGNMAEELESLWQKLTVTNEEEISVNLGKECTRATNKRGNNCLVMKVLSRRGIMLDVLRKNFRMLWKPNKSIQILLIDEEMYLVEFDDERDKRRVMDMSPWHYEKQLVLLQCFEGVKIQRTLYSSGPLYGFKCTTFLSNIGLGKQGWPLGLVWERFWRWMWPTRGSNGENVSESGLRLMLQGD